MGQPLPNLVSPGQRVSRYEILGELERGGQGVVYTALDTTLGRRVALKCPLPGVVEDARECKRLLREARAASRLSHPHVVSIFEVVEHEGRPWLAMELVDGSSLRPLLSPSRPLPVAEVLRYAEGIVSALEAAHAKDILHRDVTPGNILVTRDGRALLTDFGLARTLRVSEESSTESRDSDLDGGRVAGTFRYMSPEQALGKPLDVRSDLYSLGTVIYEMCTGQPALTADGPEALDALLHRAPVPVARLNYAIPEELDRIVRKALAKDPDERYQSARDLLVDVRTLRRRLEHDAYAEVHTPDQERPEPRRWLAPAAAALAGLLIVTVFGWWRTRPAPADTPPLPLATRALAIVPFENATGDPGWAQLADGVTDDVTSELQRSGVAVKSRQSAAKLRDLSDAEIARRLDVSQVARGRISLEDGDIVVEARLAQPSTGAEVWKASYRQPLDRLGGLYSRVANDLAIVSHGTGAAAPTPRLAATGPGYQPSFRAYEAYHRGRAYWEQRTREGFLKAIEYFKEATQLDPNYARAWAGLADAYLSLGIYSSTDPQDARRRASEAAIRALSIDSGLAEVHTSIAYAFYVYDWNWAAAEEEFLKAIELNPQYVTAHHWYADYLSAMGRPDEAMSEIRAAARLEPLSTLIQRDIAWHLFFQRDYAAAIEQLQRTLEADPQYVVARSLLGRALIEAGRPQEGLDEIQKAAPGMPRATALAFMAYGEAASGRHDRALATLADLFRSPEREFRSPYFVALAYARMSRPKDALDWLEKGLAEHDAAMTYVKVDPRFASLRAEPRFQVLVKKMNYPEGRHPATASQKEKPHAP